MEKEEEVVCLFSHELKTLENTGFRSQQYFDSFRLYESEYWLESSVVVVVELTLSLLRMDEEEGSQREARQALFAKVSSFFRAVVQIGLTTHETIFGRSVGNWIAFVVHRLRIRL